MSNEDMNRSQSVLSVYSREENPMALQAPISSQRLGKADTKLVNRSKCTVYLVLFLSAVLCGTVAYFFMEDEDIRWYTAEFDERSLEVFKGVQDLLGRSLQAGEHMSVALVFEAVARGEINLPNLTYPTFGVTTSHLMKHFTGGQMMGVAHAVSANDRIGFEAYAAENQGWISQDLFLYDLSKGVADFSSPKDPGKIREKIYGNSTESAEWSAPLWQMYPTPTNASQAPIMFDLLSHEWFKRQWDFSTELKGGTFQASIGSIHEDLDFLVDYAAVGGGRDGEHDINDPKFLILQPVVGGIFVPDIQSMGMIVLSWTEYFEDILQDQPYGIIVDVHDNCPTSDGDKYSFKSNKDSVTYIGKNVENGSILPSLSNHFSLYGESLTDDFLDFAIAKESCGYVVSVHATEDFIEQWQRNISYLAAFFIAAAFGFTAIVFFVYTYFVQKRNRLVTSTAERSSAIVTSLFPKNVADQMMQEVHHQPTSRRGNSRMDDAIHLLSGSNNATHADRSALDSTRRKDPIADSFAETTIMFADIAGFTAWSANREPTEVFTLLETIFDAFDRRAERRRVFKVETVGDCYVAVCGLPDPRPDHAIVMARYACDCRNAMKKVKRRLEKKLGPDTASLDMRFGLHSGPVTAGVIRGKNPRFQLFGDSMNKTSRIESSGERGRVHISEEMAKILIDKGKQHWISKRDDLVDLKGLGAVPTYWLSIDSDWVESRDSLYSSVAATELEELAATESEEEFSSEDYDFTQIKTMSHKEWKNTSEQITWHAKYLFACLSEVAQVRTDQQCDAEVVQAVERGAVFGKAEPLDCIQFDDSIQYRPYRSSSTPLDANLLKQLEEFVQEIAGAYNSRAFHNVHHASHVVLSLQKALQSFESNPLDPLTQFAMVVAALVHDVDHPGASNMQLVQENDALAKIYATSTAERNSLDVFWNIFGQECFLELRRAVYRTPSEFEHFRQVIVQTILATDIMDKDMQKGRVRRWEECLESSCDLGQRKTSILEQLIQAADISHTMQDWEVYQQWNRNLYGEMSTAFQGGRGEKDPSEFWYEGELGFFDFVVIPLATRLAQYPAFGKSGQEMLRNATKNREEWEREGESVVMKLK